MAASQPPLSSIASWIATNLPQVLRLPFMQCYSYLEDNVGWVVLIVAIWAFFRCLVWCFPEMFVVAEYGQGE
jgi:hypothetical protein